MQLQRFDGVDAFLAAAGDLLVAREAEHNLILGICSNLHERPEAYTASPYLATVSAGDRVVAAEARDVVAGWLSGRGRAIHLWEDAGVPVSLADAGSPTPNGIRIGPVYTPSVSRGRGYASALVAAVSQAELDAGRRFCFLFSDLANPTANHIYQSIGYQPVRDVDAYRFDRP